MLSNEQVLKVLARELTDRYGKVPLEEGNADVHATFTIEMHGGVNQKPEQFYTKVEIPLPALLGHLAHLIDLEGHDLVQEICEAAKRAALEKEPETPDMNAIASGLALAKAQLAKLLPKASRHGELVRVLELSINQAEPAAALKPAKPVRKPRARKKAG